MNERKILQVFSVLAVLVFTASPAFAENIDPYDEGSQYAWGENVGWFNLEPGGDGSSYAVTVEDARLTGYVWAENIGWVSLSCENTNSCATVNYGVTNDGSGNLSGYAWAENVGWVSFSCENTNTCGTVDYRVTIDSAGNFDGWAWAENVGWIHFQSQTPVAYKVKTSWTPGGNCPCLGDIDDSGKITLADLDAMVNILLAAGPPFIVNCESAYCQCADMDGSGKITLGDLDAIVNLLVNAGAPFIVPCE